MAGISAGVVEVLSIAATLAASGPTAPCGTELPRITTPSRDRNAQALGRKLAKILSFSSDSQDGGVEWRPNRVTPIFFISVTRHLCDEASLGRGWGYGRQAS